MRWGILLLLSFFLLSEGRFRNRRQPEDDGPNRDFYKILGLSRRASTKDIKKAYRKLSKKWHPDKNSDEGAAEKYTDIVAAYECLYDEEKRKIYDQGGESGLREYEKSGSSGGGFDPFEAFFGRSNRQRRDDSGMPKGPDVHLILSVSLRTLYLGEMLDFDYVRNVMCSNWDECEADDRDCEGPGVRMVTRQIGPGFIQKMQQHDDRCIAHGKRYDPNCKACPGGPTELDTTPLSLDIEPGMKSGETIVFEEVADETVGHSPGNLIIELQATRHEYFTRKGDDLHLRLNIQLVDALAGFSTEVEHVDGRMVTIAPTNVLDCNSVFRVKGEGMPIEGSNRKGDIVVKFNIQFPTYLSQAQKDKLRDVL